MENLILIFEFVYIIAVTYNLGNTHYRCTIAGGRERPKGRRKRENKSFRRRFKIPPQTVKSPWSPFPLPGLSAAASSSTPLTFLSRCHGGGGGGVRHPAAKFPQSYAWLMAPARSRSAARFSPSCPRLDIVSPPVLRAGEEWPRGASRAAAGSTSSVTGTPSLIAASSHEPSAPLRPTICPRPRHPGTLRATPGIRRPGFVLLLSYSRSCLTYVLLRVCTFLVFYWLSEAALFFCLHGVWLTARSGDDEVDRCGSVSWNQERPLQWFARGKVKKCIPWVDTSYCIHYPSFYLWWWPFSYKMGYWDSRRLRSRWSAAMPVYMVWLLLVKE